MTQAGTGTVRAMRVFRRRVEDLWDEADGKLWWPESGPFVAPAMTEPPAAPAAVLRVQPNRSFGRPFGFSGQTSTETGSVSFIHGVQARAGMLEAQEAGEAAVRSIADPSENDDGEDVATVAGIEVNPGISPQGIPVGLRDAFVWTQYVIPYTMAEGF